MRTTIDWLAPVLGMLVGILASIAAWGPGHSVSSSIDQLDPFYDFGRSFYARYVPPAITVNSMNFTAEDAEGYAALGEHFVEVKDYPSAVSAFSYAIRMEPNNSHYYEERGIALAGQDLYREALNDFNTYIALRPSDANGYFYRGLTYFILNRYAEAIDDFDTLKELGDTSPLYLLYRGVIYRRTYAPTLAVDDLYRYVETNPTSWVAWRELSTALRELRDWSRAVDATTRMIELDPDSGWLYRERAKLYLELGDVPNALADYEVYFRLEDPERVSRSDRRTYEQMVTIQLELFGP